MYIAMATKPNWILSNKQLSCIFLKGFGTIHGGRVFFIYRKIHSVIYSCMGFDEYISVQSSIHPHNQNTESITLNSSRVNPPSSNAQQSFLYLLFQTYVLFFLISSKEQRPLPSMFMYLEKSLIQQSPAVIPNISAVQVLAFLRGWGWDLLLPECLVASVWELPTQIPQQPAMAVLGGMFEV